MYKIILSDLTTYLGGDFKKTRWEEIPKPILSIEYYFRGQTLFLSGFEQYNHLVEGIWDLKECKLKIERSHLLVKYNNSVLNYTFDLIKKSIAVKKIKWEDNKSTGWKIGLRGVPECKLS